MYSLCIQCSVRTRYPQSVSPCGEQWLVAWGMTSWWRGADQRTLHGPSVARREEGNPGRRGAGPGPVVQHWRGAEWSRAVEVGCCGWCNARQQGHNCSVKQ